MLAASKLRWLAAGLFGWFSVACSSDGSDSSNAASGSCTPGAQIQCACTDGTLSTQSCNADGTSLTPCACGGAVPGAGGVGGVGGGVNPGAGGMPISPSTGGAINPGAGGAIEPGSGGAPVVGAGGSAGIGAGGTVSVAQCDTSTFIQNCVQGGASWGTEQQSGPCAAGTTLYGIETQFGPYGVRSEYNVGQGFENPVNPSDTAAGCSGFIDGFAADPIGSAELKNIRDLNLALYTVFYPGCMPEGERFPLITWGNGTCAMPEGYGPLLRYVASHGYIVVAANSRYVGGGEEQRRGIDFMLAENDNPSSKYYQKVDSTKIGAMGHSQGSAATAQAAADPRISAVILWNGGASAVKPFMTVSGDRDILISAAQLTSGVNTASVPAAWLFYHQVPTTVNGAPTGTLAGHLTLMMEPERVIEPAVAWWNMMLKGNQEAKSMFIGTSCTLCDNNAYPSLWVNPATPPAHEFGHNAALQ